MHDQEHKTNPPDARLTGWRLRLFDAALLSFPRAFRRRFGAEMRADAAAHAGSAATALVPFLLSTIRSGLAERAVALHRSLRFPPARPHLYTPDGRQHMFWDTLGTDIRHTLRLAVKTPLFTLLTIAALGLGIGATTAIFAVVNGVLIRSLPYRDADRLVNVWSHATQEGRPRNPLSPANFLDFQRLNSTLTGLEAYYTFVTPQELQTDAGSEVAFSVLVTPTLFDLLGRSAALGRTFTANEPPGVVVLSDGYWRRRFGADPGVIGRPIQFTTHTAQVVGVMPPDFVFPYGGMLGPSGFTRVTQVDMWLPIAYSGPQAAAHRMLTSGGQVTRNTHWFGAIGRLRPGVSREQVEADLQTVAAQLEQSYPETNKGWGATVVSAMDQTVGPVRTALLILFAGIAGVLVMASVNVANLMLARSIARERELATRTALGASRLHLARQLLTESVLLAMAGGLAGLVVLFWGVRLLIALAPPDLPRIAEVSIDGWVLGVTMLATLLTGVLVGLLPSISSASVSAQAALQDNSRGSAGSHRRRRVRSALVVAEVALAVALTTGAGLLLRSFVEVLHVNPGFETTHLLTWQMNIPDRLQSADERRAFYDDFFERMEALPGVITAGGTTRIPLGSTSVTTTVQIDGRPVPVAELPEVQFRRALHRYFAAMGIPIRRGRAFTPDDGPTAPPVVVINETMAERMFAGQDPIGQRVRTGPSPSGPWSTVIGVVGDVRHGGLEEVPQPELYISSVQNPPVSPFIVLRTTGDPAAMAETVRAEARLIDTDLPIIDMRTMETLRSEAVSTRRFILLLVGLFGLLALGMAAIGVYGVMSLVVSERTREMGVRMALGANPASVLALIVGQGTALAVVGAGIGMLIALPIMPLIRSQLYGTTVSDPMTFVAVPLLLVVVAAAAAFWPALRAMRIDPLNALRCE